MTKTKYFTTLAALILLTSACKRATQEVGDIRIQMPTTEELQKSMSAQTSSMNAALLCFGVNAKANPQHNSCNIDKGVLAGTVGPGGELVLKDVPTGMAMTFEIYGFLRNSGSETCPANMGTAFQWPVNKIHFLGKSVKTITGAQDAVSITWTLPTAANLIATHNAWPAQCAGSPTPTPTPTETAGRVGMGAAVLAGTQFKAYSRVTHKEELKALEGSQFKIKNWSASVQ